MVLAALKSPFYHASEESIIKNSFKKAGIYPTEYTHGAFFQSSIEKFKTVFELKQINKEHNIHSPNKSLLEIP